MPPTKAIPQWIGQHHSVVRESHFVVDDPEEQAIEKFHCLDCDALEERSHELAHQPCQAA
jgi:hypothetical protein